MAEDYPQADYDAEDKSVPGSGAYKEKVKTPINHGYFKSCEECGGSGKDERDGLPCPQCAGAKQYFIVPVLVEKGKGER